MLVEGLPVGGLPMGGWPVDGLPIEDWLVVVLPVEDWLVGVGDWLVEVWFLDRYVVDWLKNRDVITVY